MSEYTKGEWEVIDRNDKWYDVMANNDRDRICSIDKGDVEHALADARLIADAPVLLEACEEASKTINGMIRFLLGTGPQPTPEEMSDIVIKIEAAIAKTRS